MTFNTFSSSSRVDCAIQINFNLDAVDKGWKFMAYSAVWGHPLKKIDD